MERSTIIKRIRKAGSHGLPLRDLGTQGEALQALYAVVNDGELVTYFHLVSGATWVRVPLLSDKGRKH